MLSFDPPRTYPTPGPIGRTVRLILGAFFVYELVDIGSQIEAFMRFSPPFDTWWLVAAISVWALHDAADVWLGSPWGRRLVLVVLAVAAGAALIDFLQHGTVWGPPFSLSLYALALIGFGYIGLSFIVAAILAAPGCEAGALRYLVARLSGDPAREHS